MTIRGKETVTLVSVDKAIVRAFSTPAAKDNNGPLCEGEREGFSSGRFDLGDYTVHLETWVFIRPKRGIS